MKTSSRIRTAAGMITLLGAAVAATGQDRPAVERTLDPTVDKILTRLEDRKVSDLRAKVRWREKSPWEEDDDARVKSGDIWYREFDPVPKFVVKFDKRIQSGKRHKLDETHLFDGCWYYEIQGQTKTVTKYEVRRKDDPLNPYKIGETNTFPMPFGQKKADILAEFDVVRKTSAAGDPPKTDHLRLTPRAGTESSKNYAWVDFWIPQEGRLAGLPVKVKTARLKPTGEIDAHITITFEDVKLDSGFSVTVFEYKKPAGYHEEEHPLPAPATP